MGVYRDGVEVARILRRGGLSETVTEIASETLSPKLLIVRNRGIYIGGCVVAGLFTLLPGRFLGSLLWGTPMTGIAT